MCVHPPIQYTNFPKSPRICQQQLVFRCKCCDKPLSRRRPLSARKFEVKGGYVDSPAEYCTSDSLWKTATERNRSTPVSIIPYLFSTFQSGTYVQWHLQQLIRVLIMPRAVAEAFRSGNIERRIIESKWCFLPGSAVCEQHTWTRKAACQHYFNTESL